MSLVDIEQVQEYLRQTENDVQAMKKQFLDLATVEGDFQTEKIPIGF
jgi:alpha-amylase/alpha-mannosidase (GH57 family)